MDYLIIIAGVVIFLLLIECHRLDSTDIRRIKDKYPHLISLDVTTYQLNTLEICYFNEIEGVVFHERDDSKMSFKLYFKNQELATKFLFELS